MKISFRSLLVSLVLAITPFSASLRATPPPVPHLLKDINPSVGSTGSEPTGLVAAGNAVYFEADNTLGHFLWKSTGIAATTVRLMPIHNENVDDQEPLAGVAVNGTFFFTVDDENIGRELWKSDGTAPGTVLVKDINPSDEEGSEPEYLTAFNGKVYFAADDGENGPQLWTSDGTTAGTVIVKDSNLNGLSDPQDLAVVNGVLYFSACDSQGDQELWRSDGTTAGTVRVKDINLTGSSYPAELVRVNNTLYFSADDGVHGRELWKSDGTAGGTTMVKDIVTGSNGSSVERLVAVNSLLYFVADDGVHGQELWKSDGSANGTVQVKDIAAGSASSDIYQLTNVNGTLFFVADDGVHDREVWKSNGTDAGTMMVKDIGGPNTFQPQSLTNVGGTLYFAAGDDNDRQLWKSDGTTAGTLVVGNIRPGGSSFPDELVELNAILFFSANDGEHGTELWVSDGSPSGTALVKDIYHGESSSPTSLFVHNGSLYFNADDGLHGFELWKSDGTELGTALFKDLNPTGDGYPADFTSAGSTLYFNGRPDINGYELWKSDGTSAGTTAITDFSTNQDGTNPFAHLYVNGWLYFQPPHVTADYDSEGELWRTDGTSLGTQLVKAISPAIPEIAQKTNLNGAIFFSANDGLHGNELWKTDGTAAGTSMVADVAPGADASQPQYLTVLNNKLYFAADDSQHGTELWTSDGTAAGTVMVKDINLTGAAWIQGLTNINGTLYFGADDGVHSFELWKSDGTAAGTQLVKDINPNSYSQPWGFIAVGTRTYFSADDGTHGRELWVTDGTEAGTTLVKDINPGVGSSEPENLTVLDGVLYFTADDGTHGIELWKSDGTPAGTVLVNDLVSGSASSQPTSLTVFNHKLYFAATQEDVGMELFVFDPNEGLTPTLASSTPAPAATAVPVDANLELNFSQAVRAGTGNVILRPATGTDVTIGITDSSQVSISGSAITVNPTADLAPNTTYSVIIASGVIENFDGLPFAGIAAHALDFTTAIAPPAITGSLTATGTYGSGFTTYTIGGTNSPTSFNATGLPAGLSVDTTNGRITGTPTTTVGSPFNVTISATNAGGTGSATLVITVNRCPLSITGVTASAKVYDGTTAATLNTTSAALTGNLPADTLTLDKTGATGTFASRDVGNGKMVTTSGFIVTGAHAVDYDLSQPSTTADITAKALTTAGLAAVGRTYDATTIASLSGTATLLTPETAGAGTTNDGKPYSIDTVSITGTATGSFADRHAGSGKAVSVAGLSLTGAQAGNYTLTPANLSATITAKALSAIGLAAATRTYDGTTTASLTGTATLSSAVAPGTNAPGAPYTGDVVSLTGTPAGTFATKAVGSAKPVTVTGLALQGSQSADYTLSAPAGVTGNVTARALNVSGVAVGSKSYDGTTAASLDFTAASLGGVVGGDSVTLVTGGASGAFSDANAGSGKAVTITGLSLGGADAGNYALGGVTATGSIGKANALIAISGLTQTYNGGQHPATATTTPSGLAVTLTYEGSASAPVNAGYYLVNAAVNTANYEGTAAATLTVARATQTVTLTPPATAPKAGVPVPLVTAATSGLPVTFSIVSGNATVSGSSVTLGGSGSVVVRATQPGDGNYEPAFAEITLTAVAKLSQTITFGPLPNRRATDPEFQLFATASSGLPVTFSIVSGPGLSNGVNGSTLTLTGASGAVVVRASQAGNATYDPAPSVERAFDVIGAIGPQVFFGLVQNSGTFGAVIAPDGKSGTLMVLLSETGEVFIVNFTLNPDGTFDASVTTSSIGSVSTADVDGPRVAAAPALRAFHGKLSGGLLTGSIVDLGLSFSATVQPSTGPTAGLAGLYQSSALNSAGGSTTSIVGPQGQVLVVATTPAGVVAGAGTITADGVFSVTGQGGAVVGNVDAPSTSVSGTIIVPNQPEIPFSGLGSGTVRTDRMINLSSRARIGPDDPHTLITGFVIGGTDSKRLLLRAIGPALVQFGIGDALADPRLELYNAQGQLVLANDNWSGADTSEAMARTGAFSLPAGSKDAAVVATLAPGSYTMHVKDGGQTGVTLAEIYDASANPQGEYQRMINISSRGFVDSGNGILVGGFVVTGNSPKRVLIRGAGPALAKYGVAGALSDPRLAIYSGDTLLAQNDDWTRPTPIGASQVAATAAEILSAGQSVGAFDFAANSRDAAVVVTLAPGAYTAQVSGAAGATGTALVEVYELP